MTVVYPHVVMLQNTSTTGMDPSMVLYFFSFYRYYVDMYRYLKQVTFFSPTDHPWITEHLNQPPAPCNQLCGTNLAQQEIGSFSFSSQQAAPSRDVSFSTPSPDPCQTRPDNSFSPSFTCRSSFSAFLESTPLARNIGFSFGSDAEFPSPIPSMPSFSFSPFGETGESTIELRPEASNHIRTGILLKFS
jgi:hypothetical protein